MREKQALCAALVLLAVNATVTAAIAQQQWPARPITVVSPFFPGTTDDLVASSVLDQVGQQIGQQFVLQNKPGGDGSVGVTSVVRADPDGYTLLLSSSAMTTAVLSHKSLPYDALQDLEPVAMFGGQPSVLVAAPATGFRTVADLVAAAKSKPGALKFGSVGVGSASYVTAEEFRVAAGLDVQSVTYPGPVAAIDDLASGKIDFYFLPIAPAVPLVAQHKVVPLAISTQNHSLSLPGVKTLAESGYPIGEYLIWCGLSAPAKTPHELVDRLNDAVNKALVIPTIRNKLERMVFEPAPMSREQYGKFFAGEMAAMTKLARDAQIEPSH
jgi:tripartite-type tricarboxylate transporter receptor subunit TctC